MRRAPGVCASPRNQKSRPQDSFIDLGFLGESDQRIAFIELREFDWIELPIGQLPELELPNCRIAALRPCQLNCSIQWGPNCGNWFSLQRGKGAIDQTGKHKGPQFWKN
jgi:hypothetical protein